jgi:hypothetical protein
MTDMPETPATTPAENPTAPMPPTHAYAAAPPTAAPSPADVPPPYYAHDAHTKYHASAGAVAIMVIGALLFAALAFGAGWATRSAVLRAQLTRGGAMMGGQFGQGLGGGQGYGQGGGQGYGQGNGSGQGYGSGGQGYRHGFGRRGMMGAPNGALPNGQVPGGSQLPTASPGGYTQ